MAGKEPGSRRDPSDLFKVEDGSPAMAPVEKIVLPPGEQLKRRIQRLVLAAIASLVFFLLVHVALGWIHDRRVASALDDVIIDASPSVIENALTLVRDEPRDALRARLVATEALGGSPAKLAEAKALVDAMDDANDPDARIARIYTLLAQGDARGAHAEASKSTKYDEAQTGAFLRGRAMTSLARGQQEKALEDATAAVALYPGAPEPSALLGRIAAELQGPEAGLAALDTVDDQTAATRIARARIAGLQQADAETALALTAEVREDDEATPVQKAWAELIEGMLAYRRGAIASSYAHARTASTIETRVDEPLIVGTAQLLLALQRPAEARALLERLSTGPSADIFTRAHVLGWWYAQTGDPKAGFATLTGASFGPDKSLPSAFRTLTLAELYGSSSGGRDRALPLYREAATDPLWGVPASTALARMLADEGKTDEAIAVLETALAAHPNHLALVDAATKAYLASGRLDQAGPLTAAAIDAFDAEGWAHGSRARLLLAERKAAEAMVELDRAVELSPDDASLFALRGDAARAVGNPNAAQDSYARALQLDPNQPRALSGLLALKIDTGDFKGAAEVMTELDRAKVLDLRADEQRLRFLVRTGAGQSGFSTMRGAVSRHSRNPGLRLAAARIAMQGEQYPTASNYYQQAKRFGADARTAETGLALSQIYGRRKLAAESTIERAAETADNATEPPPTPTTLVMVWELVVKAHLALADEKRGLAVRYARRAAELIPNDADVFLLQADIEEDRERSPEEALRRAVEAPVPMPVAAGRLAVVLGPTEEGCAMAKRYLAANRTSRIARSVRYVARECAE